MTIVWWGINTAQQWMAAYPYPEFWMLTGLMVLSGLAFLVGRIELGAGVSREEKREGE